MRLLVLSHKLFRRTPAGYQTDGAFTVQMDALAPYFEKLILAAPVIEDGDFVGAGLQAKNIEIQPLPPFPSRIAFLRTVPALRRHILVATNMADLGLVVLPGYFGAYASWLCQRHDFPIFQWVVGDWRQNVMARRAGIRGLGTAVWTPALEWIIKRLTRNVLTFFNGRILYLPSQPHYYTRVSSSIRLADIVTPDDRPPQRPYQLLFVGRLAAEKGIVYLLRAVAQLRAAGEDVVLHLAGRGEQADALQREAVELSLQNVVRFHGFVPHGDALRRLYRQSDIFVLPALQDQQPKVLMEAMSQAVPVIATRTGGISTIVRDGKNGLLVPPARSDALETAIRRLLVDHALRQRLVEEGIAFVRERTVDAETARMMDIVAEYFQLKELTREPKP